VIIEVSPLTLLATIAIVGLGPAITALTDAWQGAAGIRSLAAGTAHSGAGWLGWLTIAGILRPDIDPLLVLPLTALSGVAAVLAATPARALGRRARSTLAYAALWSALVFVPVAVALFSAKGFLATELATVDLAGALPVLVAGGCGGLAVLVLERRRVERSRANNPAWVLLGIFAVVWALWILWLLGMELAIDEITPLIIANTLMTPVASVAAWLVVQRIQHAKTTPSAAVGGLLCGLVAIAPGSGNLSTIGALLTGIVAGALCSLVGYSAARRTGNSLWLVVTILLGGAGLGVGLIGALATRTGIVFTGQPEALLTQFASVAIVAVYAGAVSLACWFVVSRFAPRPAARALAGS